LTTASELGESYFDSNADNSNPTDPSVYVWLTNDYASPAESVIYGRVTGSSGVMSITVPNANNLPADSLYLISIQAGPASAYSYVLTVGSAAPAQTNGWSTQQDFVPYELIVDFKEPVQSGPLSNVQGSNQSRTSLVQRAASVGMQGLGGAPGRSMLLGFGDPAAKASALGYRTVGLLSVTRWITSSRAAGRSGCHCESGGNGSVRCLTNCSAGVTPTKGCSPVRTSYITTPRL